MTDLLIETCRTVRWQGSLSVRNLARLIGRMMATIPAVFQAPLRYRNLQKLKNQALHRSQSYETMVKLNQDPLKELDWWVASLASQNGRSILTQDAVLTMESDASLLGWGAVCEGVHTGHLWSPMERRNCLELTAAMFAMKALSRNKHSSHIHLRLNNQTVVSYVNHMVRTRSPQLNSLAMDTVSGEGNNTVSRTPTRGGQLHSRHEVLDNPVFSRMATLQRHLPEPDAGSLSVQCEPVCHTPESPITSIYQLETRPLCYGNRCSADVMDQVERLLFVLISKVLRKIREEGSIILLIALVWESQLWCPALLSMLVDYPILLPT